MKWYELRRWYRSSYSSGDIEVCFSNSIEYLKRQADLDEAYNFFWQWIVSKKRFQSAPKLLDKLGVGMVSFTIQELAEGRIEYVPMMAYEIGEPIS